MRIVDVHQVIEQRFADLDLALEAQPAGDRRQAVEEIPLAVTVFGAQGTNQHMAAIIEFLDPLVGRKGGEFFGYCTGLTGLHDVLRREVGI
ncbi:hypothetical protein D3C78_1716520 [compost metagenome]